MEGPYRRVRLNAWLGGGIALNPCGVQLIPKEARGIATEKQRACLRIEAQLIDARQTLANG